MTEQQRQWIAELAKCSFYPGSYDKRFIRDMEGRAADEALTEKQAAFLERLAYRYRRQRNDEGMAKPAHYRKSPREIQTGVDDAERLKAWNEGRPL